MLKLYIGQPYLKLVCGINHNKDVIVVRSDDEQFTPGSERWASRKHMQKYVLVQGSESMLPLKDFETFGALRLLLVAFENTSSP